MKLNLKPIFVCNKGDGNLKPDKKLKCKNFPYCKDKFTYQISWSIFKGKKKHSANTFIACTGIFFIHGSTCFLPSLRPVLDKMACLP